MYVFETLIFRWREALRESSGNFEDLQELFEIVVKFRDPQVKPRLQKIIERSPKFSELLSSDRIADALIQGNLFRDIVNWSDEAMINNFSFFQLEKKHFLHRNVGHIWFPFRKNVLEKISYKMSNHFDTL